MSCNVLQSIYIYKKGNQIIYENCSCPDSEIVATNKKYNNYNCNKAKKLAAKSF